MASNAFAGVGTIFQRAGTPLAEVNSISGPSKSRDTIDVTSLDSTGGYREFIGGFRDGGEVTLNMNYTQAGYTLLNTDFESNTLQSYTIILSDAYLTQYDFSAFVSNLTMNVQPDTQVTLEVTLKISGQVSMTS